MPYATDYTTLLTGSYWSGAEITGQPVFVTYSFDAKAPASDKNHLSASAFATFKPLTAAQQTEVKQALTDWGSASNIAGGCSGVIFLQAPAGQGDINFASYDFSSDPNNSGAGGLGYYPWGNWNYSTFGQGSGHFAADLAGAGNVLFNTADETGGLYAYNTVLHEIGHALGLKHPTDPWTLDVPGYIDVAHNQWDPSVPYNPEFSVMTPGPNTLTEPTTADFQAIQFIYGTASMAGEQDKSWSWNAKTATLTQVLNDGTQTVRGVSVNNVITAGGGNDAIYAIGAGKNTVTGGAGTDLLVGGSGTNLLIAGTGPDTFNGWFGKTTVSYQNAPSGVAVDLADPSLNSGEAAGDTYLHITGLTGSKFADTLTASSGGQTLTGLGGGDTLIGYSGGGDTFKDTAAHLNGATIQNFAAKGDAIVITDLPFKGATLTFAAGVLTVANGAKSAAITLAGTFVQSDFHLAASGAGVKITQSGGSLAPAALRFAQALSGQAAEHALSSGCVESASRTEPLARLAARS